MTDEEGARVRTVLERLVKEAGSQRELARQLGLSQQAISHVISGGGVGVGIARKVADAIGIPFEQLVGGGVSESGDGQLEPRLSSLTGWASAEAEAKRRFRHIPEAAWVAVRNIRTAQPPRILTSDWIGAIASDWARALQTPDE